MNYLLRNAKVKYYFYLFSIIMLTNGLLFNFIFQGTVLVIWRQIIWIFGGAILILTIQNNYSEFAKYRKILNHLKWSIIILLVGSLFAFAYNEYNILRIILGWMFYLFGYSFLMLPLIVVKLRKEVVFFKTLAWLGIIISIGLTIDGLYGGIFSIFKTNYSIGGRYEVVRATFLTEAATVLGVSQVFLLICNLYTSYISKSKFWGAFYIFTSFVFLIGAWSTGSRQVFYILLFTEIVAMYYLMLISEKNKLVTLVFIFSAFLAGYFILVPIILKTNYTDYLERFTSDTDRGNETRIRGWIDGINQLSFSNIGYWFTGHGFTYTMGQQSLPGEKVGYHMESSVWAFFSEMGFFAWYVFFWPWMYSVKLMWNMKKSFLRILFACFLLSYIFIAFISPNAAHPLSTMCLFIVLGFLVNYKS
jgi:hypothetical protein